MLSLFCHKYKVSENPSRHPVRADRGNYEQTYNLREQAYHSESRAFSLFTLFGVPHGSQRCGSGHSGPRSQR